MKWFTLDKETTKKIYKLLAESELQVSVSTDTGTIKIGNGTTLKSRGLSLLAIEIRNGAEV